MFLLLSLQGFEGTPPPTPPSLPLLCLVECPGWWGTGEVTGSPSTPATASAKSSSSSPPTPQGMQRLQACTCHRAAKGSREQDVLKPPLERKHCIRNSSPLERKSSSPLTDCRLVKHRTHPGTRKREGSHQPRKSFPTNRSADRGPHPGGAWAQESPGRQSHNPGKHGWWADRQQPHSRAHSRY